MTLTCRFLQAARRPACIFVCAVVGQQAQAFALSGSFSGTADATQLPLNFTPPHPESYYDGAPITGTFAVNVPDPQFQVGGDGYAYFLNGNGGTFSVSYTVKGQHFDYFVGSPDPSTGQLPSIILLGQAPAPSTFQTALFLTDFMPKYQGASFELSDPNGALFSHLDAGTLHVDPNAPPAFHTSFANASAEMAFSIDINKLIYQLAPPVPEPATHVLFAAGCGLLAWQRRRHWLPALQSVAKRIR
ncbi:MAG TPA: PEP-CTERM sorting domain-containing protein [Rhizobacter sp.]|nr:PEP-CTERM sorting domain-containing protein [Rhizobacter sp.]